MASKTRRFTNVSTMAGPIHGVTSMSVFPGTVPQSGTPFGWQDVPNFEEIKIDIIERSGPYEIILAGGIKFLRIENTLAQTAEYKSLDFQVISVNQVLSKLNIEPTNDEDFEYLALLELERCIIHKAENGGFAGDDAEAAWQTYLKLKELALQPGTPFEGMAAMKAAIKRAIDLAL